MFLRKTVPNMPSSEVKFSMQHIISICIPLKFYDSAFLGQPEHFHYLFKKSMPIQRRHLISPQLRSEAQFRSDVVPQVSLDEKIRIFWTSLVSLCTTTTLG
jgi:hypothetical protein